MTIRKKDKITKIVSHPLEEFFNIEPASTEVTKIVRKTELDVYDEFDDKDTELENTFQEVYDAAMSGYDNLQDMIDIADTKFTARLSEVSVQHLNTALAAASKRAQLKENKDKLNLKARSNTSKTQNNLIIMDRNAALQSFMENMTDDSDDIIDGEYIENDEDKDD